MSTHLKGSIMLTTAERQSAIDLLRTAHAEISAAVASLNATQLTTVYIANEWTVAQNIHHLPDSQQLRHQ